MCIKGAIYLASTLEGTEMWLQRTREKLPRSGLDQVGQVEEGFFEADVTQFDRRDLGANLGAWHL